MQKNVSIACGLGDLFIYLTHLDSFFKENKEYSSVKFWAWNHSPNLARELLGLSDHSVSMYDIEDMKAYLEETIEERHIEQARNNFIKQNPRGAGVSDYIKFIDMFFPFVESWIYLDTYKKYTTTYPFKLKHSSVNRQRPYFIIHPYSNRVSTEKPERKWQVYRWNSLIKLLAATYRSHDILVIGSSIDIPKEPKLKMSVFENVFDLRNKTTLTETVDLVYGSSCVIGINSWPTLLSSWAKIPTYAQWFVQHQLLSTHLPRGAAFLKHVYIQKPCHHNPDSRYFFPKVDEAFKNIKGVLNATTSI